MQQHQHFYELLHYTSTFDTYTALPHLTLISSNFIPSVQSNPRIFTLLLYTTRIQFLNLIIPRTTGLVAGWLVKENAAGKFACIGKGDASFCF